MAAAFALHTEGDMTCLICTIQRILIDAATSEYVALFLIKISRFYKYAAYLV